jgi:hypothetical protein
MSASDAGYAPAGRAAIDAISVQRWRRTRRHVAGECGVAEDELLRRTPEGQGFSNET